MWQNPRERKNRLDLSDQERAVLEGIIRGDRDREIAAQLGVSHSVVRACGAGLRQKLRARNRTELAIRALQFGFHAHMQ